MKSISLFSAILISSFAFGQHKNIRISAEAKPNEISIALNENNLSEMLAGANIASLYTSVNGGVTWKRTEQKSVHGVWGDPVVAIDKKGNYYHLHLSKPEDGNYIDRIVCQKSTDKGLTFNNGSYAGLNGTKAQDKHWIDVDPESNTLYISWTQFDKYDSKDPEDRSNILFSKSLDDGETWSPAMQINSVSGDCLDDDNTVEGAVPAVSADGSVNISWAGPNGLVFNRSEDGGKTWMKDEKKIDDMPGGWTIEISGIYRANGLPITKADRSGGEYNGTLYANWADQRNGLDDTDIWLSKSTDNGVTWSEAIRVNQDKTKRQQFFTWMAIDQTNGNLYFVYHDRRNHNSDSTDVYLSYSTDGGISFTDVKISETAFLPNDSVFFGDYNNIVAHNGVIRPTWTRLDENGLSVWTAIIETPLLHDPKNGDLVVEKTMGGIRLTTQKRVKGSVSIEKMDNSMRKLWLTEKLNSKGTILAVDEPLKSGVYHVTVTGKKRTYKRSLVVE